MVRIEILDAVASEKSGMGRNQQPYTIREQEAYVHGLVNHSTGNPEKFPVRCSVQLEKTQAPYPVGMYTPSDKSYRVGEYGSFGVARLSLQPVAAADLKAVAK